MKEERKYESCEDDIDLYEILEILLKNKKIAIISFFIVVIISLIGIVVMRKTTSRFYAKELTIDKSIYSINGVNRLYPEHIFLLNDTINKIYENLELKKLYESKIKKTSDGMSSKREFLENIIKLEKKKQNYVVKVKILKNKELSKNIMERFISILLEKDNLEQEINRETIEIKKNLQILNNKIELLAKNYKNQLTRKIGKNKNKEYEYINPFLELQLNEIKTIQNTYLKKIVKIGGIEDKKRIKIITDRYIIKEKDNITTMLIVCVVLGIFIGIMTAFFKNFIDNFNKKRKNTTK